MLGVAACGDDDDDGGGGGSSDGASTTEQAESKIKDVAFLDESITTFTKPMTAGVQEAADKAGINVQHFSADHDPQKQLQQCQDALATGKYQGIIIYAPDPVAAQACVKQALSQGVEVVPVDQNIAPDPDKAEIQIDGIKAMVINHLDEDVEATVELVDQACAEDKKPPCRIVKTVAVPPYHYSAYKLEKEVPIYKDKGYDVVATPTIGNFDDPDGMIKAIQCRSHEEAGRSPQADADHWGRRQ
jgi:ribose transport system substrate-binding protein